MKKGIVYPLQLINQNEELMEETILDKKIKNVIGPMGFDLDKTTQSKTLSTFFEF